MFSAISPSYLDTLNKVYPLIYLNYLDYSMTKERSAIPKLQKDFLLEVISSPFQTILIWAGQFFCEDSALPPLLLLVSFNSLEALREVFILRFLDSLGRWRT